jgi:hypothetical protein
MLGISRGFWRLAACLGLLTGTAALILSTDMVIEQLPEPIVYLLMASCASTICSELL